MYYVSAYTSDEIWHHGIKGQRWGVRRYQNEDGSLTDLGRKRLGEVQSKMYARQEKKYNNQIAKNASKDLKIRQEMKKYSDYGVDIPEKLKNKLAANAEAKKKIDILNDIKNEKIANLDIGEYISNRNKKIALGVLAGAAAGGLAAVGISHVIAANAAKAAVTGTKAAATIFTLGADGTTQLVSGAATKAGNVSSEYLAEVAYNSLKNFSGGSSSGALSTAASTIKKAAETVVNSSDVSAEYLAELGYNSLKNKF